MSTLSELYLGNEPKKVSIQNEYVVIELENEQRITLPLDVASRFMTNVPIPSNAQIVVLENPPRIDHVHVSDSALSVYLTDGRVLSCPLAWFPRLVHGTPAERNNYALVGEDDAIHWHDLDEDIELARLFEGGPSAESESSIQRWLASRQIPITT